MPSDYVLVAIEIGNQKIPAGTADAARDAGQRKLHPIFRVPSIVIPREANYILYPDATGLQTRIVFIEPFSLDARLFLPLRIIQ